MRVQHIGYRNPSAKGTGLIQGLEAAGKGG